MLRRFLSTSTINPTNKINCVDCRLYNRKTKLCAFNKLNAFDNRLDQTICGIEGKKFWSLDKTHLIKSESYQTYSVYSDGFSICLIPLALVTDYRLLVASVILMNISYNFELLSNKSKQKFLDENDRNDSNLDNIHPNT